MAFGWTLGIKSKYFVFDHFVKLALKGLSHKTTKNAFKVCSHKFGNFSILLLKFLRLKEKFLESFQILKHFLRHWNLPFLVKGSQKYLKLMIFLTIFSTLSDLRLTGVSQLSTSFDEKHFLRRFDWSLLFYHEIQAIDQSCIYQISMTKK